MCADVNEGWEPREPREPQTKSIRTGAILFGEEENKYQPAEYQLESGSRGFPGSHLNSSAAEALPTATELGIRLSCRDGYIEWEAEREPPAALRDLICDHRSDLLQILN